jgi:hypothetical protein
MKAIIWSAVAVVAISIPIAMYFFQRWRQQRADREGLVVYATVVAMEPVKVFGKISEMVKITLWIQEPDQAGREVNLRTRIAPGQNLEAGVRLCVAVDSKDPKRIYPASEEAMKRVVHTGPRRERRMMQTGRGVQAPGSGVRIGGQRRGGRKGAA